jgi:hypothetical protein
MSFKKLDEIDKGFISYLIALVIFSFFINLLIKKLYTPYTITTIENWVKPIMFLFLKINYIVLPIYFLLDLLIFLKIKPEKMGKYIYASALAFLITEIVLFLLSLKISPLIFPI